MPGRPCGPPVSPWRSAWLGSGSPSLRCPSLPSHPVLETSWPQREHSPGPLYKPKKKHRANDSEDVSEQMKYFICLFLTNMVARTTSVQQCINLKWLWTVPLHQCHLSAWTPRRYKSQSFVHCFLGSTHYYGSLSTAEREKNTEEEKHPQNKHIATFNVQHVKLIVIIKTWYFFSFSDKWVPFWRVFGFLLRQMLGNRCRRCGLLRTLVSPQRVYGTPPHSPQLGPPPPPGYTLHRARLKLLNSGCQEIVKTYRESTRKSTALMEWN